MGEVQVGVEYSVVRIPQAIEYVGLEVCLVAAEYGPVSITALQVLIYLP